MNTEPLEPARDWCASFFIMEIRQRVIPAIRRMKDFEYALELPVEYVVLLDSSLTNLHNIVHYVQQQDKKILVHADLIEGLKTDEYAIDYLAQHVKPDGIISTRRNVILSAKKYGIISILRLFLIDSLAMESGVQNARSTEPNFIEVLPGVAFSAIREVNRLTGIPIITGGLIKKEEDVEAALAAGAVSVSTSKKALWTLKLKQ
jgi:glycerol uptake operon antiterminator